MMKSYVKIQHGEGKRDLHLWEHDEPLFPILFTVILKQPKLMIKFRCKTKSKSS